MAFPDLGDMDKELDPMSFADARPVPPPARREQQGERNIRAALHYAAIVEGSDDAILSKDLDGVILSWNEGARKLFGYAPEEAVGQPVTLIIPPDRRHEEPKILETIRRGDSVRNFETVRQRKDGALIAISLTVSPIKDPRGRVIGASKIARDITELVNARDRQQLLLREMNHRVKNLFALAGSVVGLGARTARSAQELADSARERLSALARAHSLTFAHGVVEAAERPATLHSLLRTIVAPFDGDRGDGRSRVSISGADVSVAGSAVSSLALLVHEFATNAAKYGALSSDEGTIDIVCAAGGEDVVLDWTERGGPPVADPAGPEGFGGVLSRIAVNKQLGGEIVRRWAPEGLAIRLVVPRSRLSG